MTGQTTQRVTDNWQIAKEALCTRIRRRWTALMRLSSELADADSIEMQIQLAGDDAAALFRLADQVDRRLDLAFAPRSRRAEQPNAVARVKTGHDEFRTRQA